MSDLRLKINSTKREGKKDLNIQGMDISDIPADMRKLNAQLLRLNVSYNKLTSLDRIEDMMNLTYLDASNNQIQSLGPGIEGMSSL